MRPGDSFNRALERRAANNAMDALDIAAKEYPKVEFHAYWDEESCGPSFSAEAIPDDDGTIFTVTRGFCVGSPVANLVNVAKEIAAESTQKLAEDVAKYAALPEGGAA